LAAARKKPGDHRQVRGRSLRLVGLVCVDQAVKEPGELPQFFGSECIDGPGRPANDGIGGSDSSLTCGGERDQLASSVDGVRSTFDQAMGLKLVDDERRVRGVETVGLGELGERERPVAELEQDPASPGAEAEPERVREVAVAAMRIDELLHKRPSLLSETI